MSPVNSKPPSLTKYLLDELTRAGVHVKYFSKARPQYGDPWKNLLWVGTNKPFTIWVTLHRRNELAGKVQVEGYSEPFSPAELPQVGPAIVSKILQSIGGAN